MQATSKCLWDSLLLAMIDAEMLPPLAANKLPPRIKEECLGFMKVSSCPQKETAAVANEKPQPTEMQVVSAEEKRKREEEKMKEFKTKFRNHRFLIGGPHLRRKTCAVFEFFKACRCAASRSVCTVFFLTEVFCRKEWSPSTGQLPSKYILQLGNSIASFIYSIRSPPLQSKHTTASSLSPDILHQDLNHSRTCFLNQK